MPRRKSNQSSLLKRPLEEESSYETSSNKRSKSSDSCDVPQVALASLPLSDTDDSIRPFSADQQDGGPSVPAQKSQIQVDAAIELSKASDSVVMTPTVSGVIVSHPLPHSDSALQFYPSNNGSTGKPNRSLEALFQVTDSELQNMRQEPPSTQSWLPSVVKPAWTLATSSPAPSHSHATISAAGSSPNIVVLSKVGPGIVSQDGVEFVIADTNESLSSTASFNRPLHHHKVRILQHQKQLQQQQQQVTCTSLDVVVAPTLTSVSKNMPEGEVTTAECKHPALGSMLQKAKGKLLFGKQVSEWSSPSSFVSTSLLSSRPLKSQEDDDSQGQVAAAAAGGSQAGRKRKHPQKPGRYMCNFCGRGCAKPSVLQKHLRAHTGERPFPCLTCGFSFKTKSNLYKHRKSLAHAGRLRQGQADNSPYKTRKGQGGGGGELLLESDPVGSEMKEDSVAESDSDLDLMDSDAEDVEAEKVSTDSSAVLYILPAFGSEAPSCVGEDMATISTSADTIHKAQSAHSEVPLFEKPVQEEYIHLENIPHKIDKKRLVEWSKHMDKIKHSEDSDLLHQHSQFPVRIAPKSGSNTDDLIPVVVDSLADKGMKISPERDVVRAQIHFPREECGLMSSTDDAHLVRHVSTAGVSLSHPLPMPVTILSSESEIASSLLGQVEQEQAEVSKSLQQLENDKISNASGCTYTFKTLPDNAIQVTIHMTKESKEIACEGKGKVSKMEPSLIAPHFKDHPLPKASSVTSGLIHVASSECAISDPNRLAPKMPPLLSRSISADCKALTPEMLTERIQQLISANAAIVDMPMADPPRAKGRFSRQNSDSSFHSWKLNDPISTGKSASAASLQQILSSMTSTVVPNATSGIGPIPPIPAEGNSRGATSVSMDAGYEKCKDLRRSLSVSNVKVGELVHASQSAKALSEWSRKDADIHQIHSLHSESVSNVLTVVKSDSNWIDTDQSTGRLPMALSLGLVDANSCSQISASTIKPFFTVNKAESMALEEAAISRDLEPVTTSKVTVIPLSAKIGQPGVQFPLRTTSTDASSQNNPQSAQDRTNLDHQNPLSTQDKSVIKDILNRGAIVTSTLPTKLPTSFSKKLETRVKSADAALFGTQKLPGRIIRRGNQQVVLTVKDIHSCSLDSSVGSVSLNETKIGSVRDAILGIPSNSHSPKLDPNTTDSATTILSGEEPVLSTSTKCIVCSDCGVSFNQLHLLNMHRTFYCATRSKPMPMNSTIAGSSSNTKSATVSTTDSHAASGKLWFHHQSQEDMDDKLTARPSNSPAFLKFHSTTEIDAQATWNKEDYPQLRSQLTLRPSQSVDVSRMQGEGQTTKAQQNFIIENIDPLVPPKKGRPKGSKNKPKDLNMILAKANAKAAATKAFAGISPASHSPLVSSMSSSPLASMGHSPSPSVCGAKIAPKLILPRAQQFFTPLLTITTTASARIGQPMVSLKAGEEVAHKMRLGNGSSTPGIQLSPGSSSFTSVAPLSPGTAAVGNHTPTSQVEVLSSTTGFPLGIPHLMAPSHSATLMTPSTPGTPGTPGTPTLDAQSLWRLKLKGKLLMKRSISEQRMMVEEAEKVSAKSSIAAASTVTPSSSSAVLLATLHQQAVAPVSLVVAASSGAHSPLPTAGQFHLSLNDPIQHATLGVNKAFSLDSKLSQSAEMLASMPLHPPQVLRAFSEPVIKDCPSKSKLPKLDILSASQRVESSIGEVVLLAKTTVDSLTVVDANSIGLDTGQVMSVQTTVDSLSANSLVPSVFALDEGRMHQQFLPITVPVVLAQPLFLNTQTPSGAFHSWGGGLVKHGSRSSSLQYQQPHLGSVFIAGSNLTLPAIPISSLFTSPHSNRFALTPTSLVPAISQTSPQLPTSNHSSTQSASGKSGAMDKEEKSDGQNTLTRTQIANDVADLVKAPLTAGSSERHSATSIPAVSIMVPLYLYGHSYPTLHASTYVTFCCVKRPQPMYVQVKGSNRRVSMYSNWRLSKHNPNPAGLTSRMLLALYSSRYTSNPTYATCPIMQYSVTHSSYWQYHHSSANKRAVLAATKSDHSRPMSVQVPTIITSNEENQEMMPVESSMDMSSDLAPVVTPSVLTKLAFAGLPKEEAMEFLESKGSPAFRGGYKSNDIYEYIRGRGRGKYVCEMCGIRCKKPSMLKKHLRSHTDLRPYHCPHCKFSFKTKGNLTKHMKSKAHQKRCLELGIYPIPISVEDNQIDEEALAKQSAIAKQARILDGSSAGGSMHSISSLEGDEEEGDDEDDVEDEEDEDGIRMDEDNAGRTGRPGLVRQTSLSSEVSDPDTPSLVYRATKVIPQPALEPLSAENRSPSNSDKDAASSPSRDGLFNTSAAANLDTEIARSLLDLSRKVEAQTGGDQSTASLEKDEACKSAITRLDSLIGTLMSRTSKPLSGLQLEADNTPIIVRFKEVEGRRHNVGSISQDSTTPIIQIDSVSDGELEIPLKYSSAFSEDISTCAAQTTVCADSKGDKTVESKELVPAASRPTQLSLLATQSSPLTLPTHMSFLTPPHSNSLGTVLLSATLSSVTTSPILTSRSLQTGSLPSPSLMKFLPAYMSAHKFPGFTPSSQGPIVGQLIPKAAASQSSPSVSRNSINTTSAFTPVSAHTPQPFHFNTPFEQLLQLQHGNMVKDANTALQTPFEELEDSRMAKEGKTALLQTPLFLVASENGGSSLASSPKGLQTSPSLQKERSLNAENMPRKSGDRSTALDKTVVTPSIGQDVRPLLSEHESTNKLPNEGSTKQWSTPGEAKLSEPATLSSPLHLAQDTNAAAGKSICDLCKAVFSSKDQMMNHRTIHFKKMFCATCGKSFWSESQLKRHSMANLCSSPRKWQELGKSLTESQDNKLSFSCTFCSVSVGTQSDLSEHLHSEAHIGALERLGMLPLGTYQRSQRNRQSASFPQDKQATIYGYQQPMLGTSSEGASGNTALQQTSELSVINTTHVSSSLVMPAIEWSSVRRKRRLTSCDKVGGFDNDHRKRGLASCDDKLGGFDRKRRLTSYGKVGGFDSAYKGFVSQQTCEEEVSNKQAQLVLASCVHSIDSDPDADNLIIDESQVDTVDKRLPTTIPPTIDLKMPSVQQAADLLHIPVHILSTSLPAVANISTSEVNSSFKSDLTAKEENWSTSKESANVSEQNSTSMESSGGPAICGLCKTDFTCLQDLKTHLLSHAELRPHVCEFCDAGFTNAQSLRTHLHTHKQERPYICGLCGDTFAQSDDLRTHHASHSKTSIIRPSEDVTSSPETAMMHSSASTALIAGSFCSATSSSVTVAFPQSSPTSQAAGVASVLRQSPVITQVQASLVPSSPSVLQPTGTSSSLIRASPSMTQTPVTASSLMRGSPSVTPTPVSAQVQMLPNCASVPHSSDATPAPRPLVQNLATISHSSADGFVPTKSVSLPLRLSSPSATARVPLSTYASTLPCSPVSLQTTPQLFLPITGHTVVCTSSLKCTSSSDLKTSTANTPTLLEVPSRQVVTCSNFATAHATVVSASISAVTPALSTSISAVTPVLSTSISPLTPVACGTLASQLGKQTGMQAEIQALSTRHFNPGKLASSAVSVATRNSNSRKVPSTISLPSQAPWPSVLSSTATPSTSSKGEYIIVRRSATYTEGPQDRQEGVQQDRQNKRLYKSQSLYSQPFRIRTESSDHLQSSLARTSVFPDSQREAVLLKAKSLGHASLIAKSQGMEAGVRLTTEGTILRSALVGEGKSPPRVSSSGLPLHLNTDYSQEPAQQTSQCQNTATTQPISNEAVQSSSDLGPNITHHLVARDCAKSSALEKLDHKIQPKSGLVQARSKEQADFSGTETKLSLPTTTNFRQRERTGERRPTICRQEEIEIGDQDLLCVDYSSDDKSMLPKVSAVGCVVKCGDRLVSDRYSDVTATSATITTTTTTSGSVVRTCADKLMPEFTVEHTWCRTQQGHSSTGLEFVVHSNDGRLRQTQNDRGTCLHSSSLAETAGLAGSETCHYLPAHASTHSAVANADFHHSQQNAAGVAANLPSYSHARDSPSCILSSQARASHSPILSYQILTSMPDASAASGIMSHFTGHGLNGNQHHDRIPTPSHPQVSSKDQEVEDLEIQSYFSDRTLVRNAQDLSVAILMSEEEGDDPQLLVCDEELPENSYKDHRSDAEEEAAIADHGDQSLSGRNAEWDGWGALTVDVQTGDTEGELMTSQ